MSNDLQIIYVTFPSIIVFAEDINCVTNIKLSAKRAELSSPLWECRAICTQTNMHMAIICPTSYTVWRFFTWNANLGGRWCMCFLSPVITGPAPLCRALTSSVPQAALQGGWGICRNMASDTRAPEALWCEYPTPGFVLIRVKVWPAEISVGRDLGLKNGNLKTGMNVFW